MNSCIFLESNFFNKNMKDECFKRLKACFSQVIEFKSDEIAGFKNYVNNLSDDENGIYIVNDSFWINTDLISGFISYCSQKNEISTFCTEEQLFGDSIEKMCCSVPIPLIFCYIPRKYFKSVCDSVDEELHDFFRKLTNESEEVYADHMFNDDLLLPPIIFDQIEYIEKYNMPIIYFGSFMVNRFSLVKYACESKMSELYRYICLRSGLSQKALDKFFLSRFGSSGLKNILNLNYVIAADRISYSVSKKCAGFIYLYYKDLFEKYAEYIALFPEWMDIYIATDSDEKIECLRDLLKNKKSNINYIKVVSRGRDIAAFLVGFKEYTKAYDYFVFLHDKRSHSGEYKTCGESFSDLLWDNLAGSAGLMTEIVRLLDEHQYLGVLAPPHPYFGIYNDTSSDFWTICYDQTVSLMDRLDMDVYIDRNTGPLTIGNMFWCRYEAIHQLCEYGWINSDFPEEPMPLDGTISHAVERSIGYVAQYNGFYTGMVISDKNITGYYESMLSLNGKYSKMNYLSAVSNNEITDYLFTEKRFGVNGYFKILIRSVFAFLNSVAIYIKKLGGKTKNGQNKKICK